jgi:hypothetical protein
MSAQDLLNRLESVRQRPADQWSARCPAHDDRSPSLSVRETAEGLVLMHCFGGCSAAEVLASIGLEASSLFPKSPGGRPLERRRLISASQALEVLASESLIIQIVASDIARGKPIDEATRERVATAAGRIEALRLEVST